MPQRTALDAFSGELISPGDAGYDAHREVWNAMVERRPALIARCTSAADVAAGIRHGREAGLEIAVKCGGHSVLGLSVPDGGLMIDLTPMNEVRVDVDKRTAWVEGGALLRKLDAATVPHGLATTAGNISHTGVGGLTLGGGMGWLARQFGLACDNVVSFTLVTADGDTVRANDVENPDLYWGLRGGGGNFGVVTEFEFRLKPTTGQVLAVALTFDAADPAARRAIHAWRDLLPDAPREATLSSDLVTAGASSDLPRHVRGRPVVDLGFVWVGEMADARRYLDTFRSIGAPLSERVDEMGYLNLQTIADDFHHPGLRRYSAGHYLNELSDAALDAYLSRGIDPTSGGEPDWSRVPVGGFQAYGGAIAEVGEFDTAFSHRKAVVEFFAGAVWDDATEDASRIGGARRWARMLQPYSTGTYVNVIADAGEEGITRAYHSPQLARLADLKRKYDPENVFHLNQNIKPAPQA